jgi:hypothetical protein
VSSATTAECGVDVLRVLPVVAFVFVVAACSKVNLAFTRTAI